MSHWIFWHRLLPGNLWNKLKALRWFLSWMMKKQAGAFCNSSIEPQGGWIGWEEEIGVQWNNQAHTWQCLWTSIPALCFLFTGITSLFPVLSSSLSFFLSLTSLVFLSLSPSLLSLFSFLSPLSPLLLPPPPLTYGPVLSGHSWFLVVLSAIVPLAPIMLFLSYLAIRKGEISLLTAVWMELDVIIMLSPSQRERKTIKWPHLSVAYREIKTKE